MGLLFGRNWLKKMGLFVWSDEIRKMELVMVEKWTRNEFDGVCLKRK